MCKSRIVDGYGFDNKKKYEKIKLMDQFKFEFLKTLRCSLKLMDVRNELFVAQFLCFIKEFKDFG